MVLKGHHHRAQDCLPSDALLCLYFTANFSAVLIKRVFTKKYIDVAYVLTML